MPEERKVAISLALLRAGVFIVIFIWGLDKIFRPEHAAIVFAHFYKIPSLGTTMAYIFGALQVLLALAFLAGLKKRLTYGLVTLFHAVSTFSSFAQYLSPFEKVNLLFFAAWPMLAACVALYLLRDHDTLWVYK